MAGDEVGDQHWLMHRLIYKPLALSSQLERLKGGG
jgi:hypothetical protein